jgi:hypothetical protein
VFDRRRASHTVAARACARRADFYNHAIRHPAWQSSAWAFNFGTKRWREIHGGEKEGAPSARYSCTAVLYDNALWMFGGDDGGHKHSMFNYVFQAWFNQMWRFDLRTYSWQQVRPNGAPPVKRALHSAVTIGNSMYLYGGLELADTWRYDFASASWTLLVPPPADTDTKDGSHPGRRHAFAAAANTGGFYIFGGCRHVSAPPRPRPRPKIPTPMPDHTHAQVPIPTPTPRCPASAAPPPPPPPLAVAAATHPRTFKCCSAHWLLRRPR